ncbi:transcriptional repressor LexA [Patescibacteria group bacterium]|nr:transcriptional repressor LexA [Patescibacteria group bacterium]MBU2633251.1 transcriptional repressor LexA [Patescibacteria group bacterium]
MLTKNQKEVLDFIKTYIKNKGYAPSLEEIKGKFKLASVSTAHYYVSKLQELGLLEKKPNQPRSIGITIGEKNLIDFLNKKEEAGSIAIPIVGSANCGDATILAEENVEGYLKVPKNKIRKQKNIFALRASGDSLNKANINGKNIKDGDFAIVDYKNRTPENGDYVLSIIDGCANLKKFEIDKKTKQQMLVSKSTNPKHKPIYLSSEDNFMVNGKIIAVIKK